MEYMYITNDVEIAKVLDQNNIITWIDLEKLGKEERQKGMNTVKSNHQISDIQPIKSILKKTPLLVRINPMNENTEEEINSVVEEGADIVMLPMFKTREDVKLFLELIDGRCKTMLLFETKDAVDNIDDILSLPGIDKAHIGLNDLHLSYGMEFMFTLVTNGIVENICKKFKEYSLEYGFGGVAKLGYGDIPGEFILMEHKRLGSSRAILARSFCNSDQYANIKVFKKEFEKELARLKKFEKGISVCGDSFMLNNHATTIKLVENIRK